VSNFKPRRAQFVFAKINHRLHNTPDLFDLDRPVGSKANNPSRSTLFLTRIFARPPRIKAVQNAGMTQKRYHQF
jgi:hypothetical protein